MFRVPTSPFDLKKSFSPTGSRPLKIHSRRLSNTSDERVSPIIPSVEIHDHEIVRESDVEDTDVHEHSGTSTASRNDKKGSGTNQVGEVSRSGDDQIVKESFVPNGNNNEEELIEDSFVRQLRIYPSITPPQSNKKRKKHEVVPQSDKSSKHKKSRTSNQREISFDLTDPSSPANANSTQLTDSPQLDVPIAGQESQQFSKERRKEERRRKKEEKKARKEERKRQKIQSASSGAMNPSDHDEGQDESISLGTNKELQGTQRELEQTRFALHQESIEMGKDSLDLRRPARQQHELEIPAAQSAQEETNPQSDHPSDNEPSKREPPIREQSDTENLAPSRQKITATKPPSKATKVKRPAPSKPSAKTSRKITSNEKILDSSASEEEPEPEPKSYRYAPRKRTDATIADTEPQPRVPPVALGRFTLEEDKRLLRIAKAYRVVCFPALAADLAEKGDVGERLCREIDGSDDSTGPGKGFEP